MYQSVNMPKSLLFCKQGVNIVYISLYIFFQTNNLSNQQFVIALNNVLHPQGKYEFMSVLKSSDHIMKKL